MEIYLVCVQVMKNQSPIIILKKILELNKKAPEANKFEYKIATQGRW